MSYLYGHALAISCDHCRAPAGDPCRTSGGHRASMPHNARAEPVRLAWLDGWHEGKLDGIDRVRRRFARDGVTAETNAYVATLLDELEAQIRKVGP